MSAPSEGSPASSPSPSSFMGVLPVHLLHTRCSLGVCVLPKAPNQYVTALLSLRASDWNRFSLRASGRNQTCQRLDFGLPGSRTDRKHFHCFKPPGCLKPPGGLVWQPQTYQKTHTLCSGSQTSQVKVLAEPCPRLFHASLLALGVAGICGL